MGAYLEVRGLGRVELVPLPDHGETVSIGRGPDNTVVLDQRDRLASSVHAALIPLGGGWCVRDLGSRNGTTVGGERLTGDRFLRGGDELAVGQTRLTFRSDGPSSTPPTEGAAPPPELTRRERDVLRELCRPLFQGHAFAEAASMREVAAELVVGEAAVQQHLLRLYQKFDIADGMPRRRVMLANEAVRRGAVSIADIREAE